METVTAKLCQHVETSENEWTCPTCKHVAKTTAKPGRRECGPSKPRAQKPKAIGPRAREDELARKIPTCAHRGAIVEHNKSCQVCGQKNEQYDLYACGIHGTCSLSRRAKAGEKLQACTSCQDFVPLQNLIQSVKPVGTVDVCLIAPALWNLGGIERWLVAMSRYLPLVSGRQVRVSSVVIQFAHMVESEMLAELSQVTTVYSWGNQSQQQAARNAIHQSDVAIISGRATSAAHAPIPIAGFRRSALRSQGVQQVAFQLATGRILPLHSQSNRSPSRLAHRPAD